MYKVLLVDDEYYIRQRLKTCIEWEEQGFEIVGEASGADEALSILEQGSINMAVVDISMPQKDGLTLIKELRDRNISAKIIILSGYGTFEYAQKAIRYGVTQYLLKPIDEDELIRTLQQLRQDLDSEHAMKNIHQTRRKTDHLLTVIRKENYFKKIFTTHPLLTTDIHALNPLMKDYGLSFQTSCRVLVFDFQCPYLQTLNLEDLQLFRYAANNILCEIALSYFVFADAADIFGHQVLVCETGDEHTTSLTAYMERAAKKVKELLNLDICFGCSAPFRLSLENLNSEYQHALSSYVMCNIRDCFYCIYDLAEPHFADLYGYTKALEKIDACFLPGCKKELSAAIESFFDLLEHHSYPFFFLEQILSRLVMICCAKAGNTPGCLSDDLSYLMGFKEMLFAGYNLAYIKEKIHYLFLSMLATKHASSAGNVKESLVMEAVNFIDAHYSRCDMSLTLLSQNLLISPAYLSTMFKKIKGISISQYLTQVRLIKAKELLNDNRLTLTEIAEQVGYNDIFYFSKVFKRHFGVAPSACRPSS